MTKDPARPDLEFYDPGPKGPSGFGRAIVIGLAILAALLVAALFLGVSTGPVVVMRVAVPAPPAPAVPAPPAPAAPAPPAPPEAPPADR